MKSKTLKKFLSLITLIPATLLAGCFGGTIDVPDNPDINDIINTDVSGLSHTYNDYPFIGAYIFTDNGPQTLVTDGYSLTQNDVAFKDLINRQFELLAQDIAYRLYSVYGSEIAVAEKSIGFGEDQTQTPFSVKIKKYEIIDNDIKQEVKNGASPKYDLNNVDGFSLGDNSNTTLKNYSYISNFIEASGSNIYLSSLKEQFNLNNAIFGGQTYNYNNQSGNYEFVENSYVAQARWLINENFSENVVNKIKLILLNTVAKLENNTSEEAALNVINHLGFTQLEKQQIVTEVLNKVIGENAISYDLQTKQALVSTINYTYQKYSSFNKESSNLMLTAQNIQNKLNSLDLYYAYWTSAGALASEIKTFGNEILNDSSTPENEQSNWIRAHEYKGYEFVVPSIINSAFEDGEMYNMFNNTIIDSNTDGKSDVNLYSLLPRAQVLYMDIYTLQGTSKEEVENSEDGDVEYDEDATYVQLKKYLPDLNIISIVLLPNSVTGHPNVMVDGEFVPDESVMVNGFLLGSIDFAVSGESGYNSTMYADFEIKAKGNFIKKYEDQNFRSDVFEVYGDAIPENDTQSAFNVYTDLLPLQDLKDGKSKDDFLIGGYDGKKVEDYDLSYVNLTTSNGGEYKLYNLKTGLDFLSFNDDGLVFDGGNNYIKVNFIFAEIFNANDTNKTNNIVNTKVNTLLNILTFNPEAC